MEMFKLVEVLLTNNYGLSNFNFESQVKLNIHHFATRPR